MHRDALFVLALLAYCIIKFRVSSNPDPSRVTHNTLLEVAWTVIPIFILVIIAVPSFKLLYAQYDPSKIYEDFDPQSTRFLTVKAIGNQWNWDYEYAPDSDNQSFGVENEISFTSIMLDSLLVWYFFFPFFQAIDASFSLRVATNGLYMFRPPRQPFSVTESASVLGREYRCLLNSLFPPRNHPFAEPEAYPCSRTDIRPW